MTMSITDVARGAADLLFQERKITSGAMAIAQGFQAIRDSELWRFKVDADGNPQYTSFEDYCDKKWGHIHSYRSIQAYLTEAQYVELLGNAVQSLKAIDTTVTDSKMLHGVTLPSKLAHTQALRGAGGSVEDQAQIWQDTLEAVGGDPKNATVAKIKEQIDQALEVSAENFPVGTPVEIDSGIPNMVYNGYEGHVIAHEASKCVTVQCPTSEGPQRITALVDWLTKLDKPMIAVEQPKPRPKPAKKSPLEVWKDDAIALFNRIYLEVGEHLSTETVQAIKKMIGDDNG